MRATLPAMLLLLLLVGCQPTMEMGTPTHRHAQQAWQGYCIRVATPDDATAHAEKLGRDSWELVSVTTFENHLVACFKRPRGH